eukprot:3020174-Pyramimonas_sp.AAC.1
MSGPLLRRRRREEDKCLRTSRKDAVKKMAWWQSWWHGQEGIGDGMGKSEVVMQKMGLRRWRTIA